MPRLTAAGEPVHPVEFTRRLEPLLDGLSGALAVAVSGGADSVALLHLCDGWARSSGRDLLVYTACGPGPRTTRRRSAVWPSRWGGATGS